MTIGINDLIKSIKMGSDIEFSYNGKSYTILPWTTDGIVIGPQNQDDDEIYQTAEALINNHIIDGKYIKDIIDDIKILLM